MGFPKQTLQGVKITARGRDQPKPFWNQTELPTPLAVARLSSKSSVAFAHLPPSLGQYEGDAEGRQFSAIFLLLLQFQAFCV